MLDNIPYITRTGEPSNLDTAEYGTLCKVTSDNKISYYIQLSIDSENPKWTMFDSINEKEILEHANQLKLK